MPYGLETDRAELGSSSRRSKILQCESGRTQVPNVESTKPHTSTYPILCFQTTAREQREVTKSLKQSILHTQTRKQSKVSLSLYQAGGSCTENAVGRLPGGCPHFMSPAMPRASHVMGLRCLSYRFGHIIWPALLPCITRYGVGSASLVP